ncbi:hypothetical protein ACHAWO_003476 [Cyclotella atomus]|uniref:Uncharacterized protein n=1 Tax=Cyclotella atomus TaxID=382360 RepID=A0ABD3NLD3_9STRA
MALIAADTVGPSIYGGSVQRHANGSVIYTFQYEENDHHRPGPVYDGNGYSIMSRAIHFGPEIPCATPLHVCGMSKRWHQTILDIGAEVLVKAGIDPNSKVEEADSTPIEIAKRQRAIKFLMAMQLLGRYD